MGWAAAALILAIAYFMTYHEQRSPIYTTETLELNDQAGEIQLQQVSYPLERSNVKYRADGRLIPNYQALWKHPLVPREKSL